MSGGIGEVIANIVSFLFIVGITFFILYVGAKAYNNGHKGWFWVIILSIILTFGFLTPFVALVAYFKTKNVAENYTYSPPSPHNVNGMMGTKFLGASDRLSDHSFTATEWFIFIIPLFPLRSDRVRYTGEENKFSQSTTFYDILGPAPLDTYHILKVYGFVVLSIIIMGIVTVMNASESTGSIILFWLVFIALLIAFNKLFKAK